MNILQIIADNMDVIIGGSFTLIGIFIGWGLNLIQSHFQNKQEKEIHLREKKEEVYLNMLNILYLLRNEALNSQNKDISKIRKKEIDECYAPINTYASKKVINKYNQTAKNIDLFFMESSVNTTPLENAINYIDEFIALIRKELGIKD